MDRVIESDNQTGFYEQLQRTRYVEGSRKTEEQYIRDEGGVLLRNIGEISGRRASGFNTLLSWKSQTLDDTIIERFPAPPVSCLLPDTPTMIEMWAPVRSMADE